MKQYKAWELLPEEKVYLKSEADKVIAEKDKASEGKTTTFPFLSWL